MKYRFIYNMEQGVIDIVKDEDTSVTATSESIIVDTVENAKIALAALGIDVSNVDEIVSNL